MTSSRVFVPAVGHEADGNIIVRHPAERGSWIWHPSKAATATSFLRFRLRFKLEQPAAPLVHVTGDQRFQLRCDGRDVTFGPDRCDVEHWTVQTVKIELPAGEHELDAVAWYIGEPSGISMRSDTGAEGYPTDAMPPMAQITWRAGFLLYAEGVPSGLLNTGEAPWTVEDITDAVTLARHNVPQYHDIGPSFTFDLGKWSGRESVSPVVVMPPLISNPHGVRRPGWCLYPAVLAEQRREPWSGGKIRAYRASWDESAIRPEECRAPEIAAWQKLLDDKRPVTIPARTKLTVLWDLANYFCGYPLMKTDGGRAAVIEWEWAESLYEEADSREVVWQSAKGNRNEIENKSYRGFGDRWRLGEAAAETPSLWWRAGRYVRLRIETADAPLTLTHLGLVTTGYPLDVAGEWRSSDASWDALMPLFMRALKSGAHETWVDTPYYEQLCYVGDTLIDAFSNYAWFRDTRLSRRALQLFDWSRRGSGLVKLRYPSNWLQEAPTNALLWTMFVRDYAWWCDDLPFVRSLLPGLRSLLAQFDGLADGRDLLGYLPGWPVVDWTWPSACAPGILEGDSSIANLHWVLALQALAQVEDACGDPLLAQRNRAQARRVFDATIARYWDAERGLLLDTHGRNLASEHAQMYALLTSLLDEEKTAACLSALRKGEGLAKATIVGSFYVLNALYQHRDEAEFHRRLEYWRTLPGLGFTSTPESPEPTRSDAHAWGAHPAWHSFASIAGVRPDAPGFARVKIAPMPGPFEHFTAKVVHPRGFIDVAFRQSRDAWNFTIQLPEGVSGDFAFCGKSAALQPGKNEIGS